MRQKTKKQLREEIHELRNELFRSIGQLPNGELKKSLSQKYPDYYVINYIDKYGNENFTPFLDSLGRQPENNTGGFRWFEGVREVIQTKPGFNPLLKDNIK